MGLPAIVTAGEGRAARAVYGESKVYLEVAGLPLVARVVIALQYVPEVDEVLVIGDAARLEALFEGDEVRARIAKPLRILQQMRNLMENAWQGYRCALPGAGPDGRDPANEADEHFPVLYVSGDLPLAMPQEISDFIRRSREFDCDYALGLVPEESLLGFRPTAQAPGIRVATFNIRDGRLRQSNLHYAKPARLGNRYYIEEMYEHRYQRQFGQILYLGWKLLWLERGGPSTLFFYGIIHLAGISDRRGLRWLSDLLRPIVSLERVEAHLSRLLKTDFRFVVTEAGGCAVDVDREDEYDALQARFEEWEAAQKARAVELYGPLALPAASGESGR